MTALNMIKDSQMGVLFNMLLVNFVFHELYKKSVCQKEDASSFCRGALVIYKPRTKSVLMSLPSVSDIRRCSVTVVVLL